MNTAMQPKIRAEQTDEFETKILDISRVARMTAGGRRFKIRLLVAVGDKAGRVGIAMAKGQDTEQAMTKASRLAKKHLITVPLRNGTIPYEVEAKYSAARILLKPQVKGRGLVAGGVARVICQLAGIKDISAKVLGATRNKLNNARAVMKALGSLRVSEEA